MDKINYRSLSYKLICFAFFAVVGVLFFKYLFGDTVPFLVAWGLAYLIFPLADELASRLKLSRKLCSFVLVLLVITVIMCLLFLIGNRLLFELQNLLDYLTENSEVIAGYFAKILDFFSTLSEKLPIINKLQETGLSQSITENVNSFISNIWQGLLTNLGSAVPDLAAEIVKTLPDIFIVSLVTVISCFYFAVDIDVIQGKIAKIIPDLVLEYLIGLKERIGVGMKRYLRAYAIILCITFTELVIGFLVLGVDYAFVLALIIALVDFLPVFGTGAILVPWGIVLLIMKNYYLAIGIFILFGVITVVRQVIEPKIVGKSLGVHPIATLITLYVGYKLFGIVGMIVLPLATVLFFASPEKEPIPEKKK